MRATVKTVRYRNPARVEIATATAHRVHQILVEMKRHYAATGEIHPDDLALLRRKADKMLRDINALSGAGRGEVLQWPN